MVGWSNLGININEKLKGVVKKDKKIEYSQYKNPSCEAKNYSRFYFLSIANQRQDRNIHSRTHTAQTLTFTHKVNDVQCIQCCVYGRYQLALCIRTLSISAVYTDAINYTLSISNIKLAITCIIWQCCVRTRCIQLV